MAEPVRLLFICTHNRCRSILAEALANHYGEGKVSAMSAGAEPAGAVHPLTLKHLTENNIETATLKSQSWDEFEEDDIDYVITVCDKAANEPCPVWFGKAQQLHWGLADPSAIKGSDIEIAEAFDNTSKQLKGLLAKHFQLNC